MIDPEMAFQQLILADPRMAQLGATVFTAELPEDGAYPQICIWCSDDTPGQTFDGSDGTVDQTWRFDCYSENYDDLKVLRRIVKDALIFSGEQLAGGGKRITLADQGELVILSSMWRSGTYVSFDQNNQKVHCWEIDIEFGVWEDAA